MFERECAVISPERRLHELGALRQLDLKLRVDIDAAQLVIEIDRKGERRFALVTGHLFECLDDLFHFFIALAREIPTRKQSEHFPEIAHNPAH
uniref:Uncharacterized protein n=1 Tax=biofilter metagenome TaxID=1070537 RepID=A0A1A7GCS2_9ZZZZ